MATTAVEISAIEPGYDTKPVRRAALRMRVLRSSERTIIASGVLPLHPASFGLAVPTARAVDQAANGDDRTTRIVNVFVASLGLLLAIPLFLLIAIAIRLTSRGPVFYKQTRIGLDRRWNKASSHEDVRTRDLGGRPFTMYKFRTMVTPAHPDTREVWATPQDQRVTKVGRFLRATRLDELPQLLNVVIGEMNIVGPRPEQPAIFAELREAIPNYHMRQRVMPGITGWAQINQSYDTCIDDVRSKVAYDLEYLGTRSVLRDLWIMGRTVPIMLFCRLGW